MPDSETVTTAEAAMPDPTEHQPQGPMTVETAASLMAEGEPEADQAPTDADAPDSTETGPEAPPRYTVTIDGESHEVTLDELRSGYQRQADYTRKTQEVAAERRLAAELSEHLGRQRQLYDERLGELDSQLRSAMPDLSDIERLWEENPLEAARRSDQARRIREQREAIHQERQVQAAHLAEARDEAYRQELMRQEARLPELIPEWRDGERSRAERAEIKRFLIDNGYEDGELRALTDARAVKLARDAMLYRRLQDGKAELHKKVAKAPPLAKPGSGDAGRAPDRQQVAALRKRHRQGGSLESAAALLSALG